MKPTAGSYARGAGIAYLTTHITSVAAVISYRGGALAEGVVLEFVLALGCVGTGVLLWLLLRPYGPARASAFALLRTVEAAVIIAGALPMVVLLRLPTQIRAATIPLEHLHDAAFLLGQGLVISVNTIILGWLLFDASVVPRALATLGVTGGAIVLASNLAQLFGAVAPGGAVAALCAIPVFGFELWLAAFLIVRGIRPPTDTGR